MKWECDPPDLQSVVPAESYWWYSGKPFNRPVVVRVNKGVRKDPGHGFMPALNFEFFADGLMSLCIWRHELPGYWLDGRWCGPIATPPEWRE